MKKRTFAALIAVALVSGAVGASLIGPATAAGENPKAWGNGVQGYRSGTLTGTADQIQKKNITTPGDGALMIVASVTMEDDCEAGGVGVVAVQLRVDSTDVWTSGDFTAESSQCFIKASREQRSERGIEINWPSDTVTVTAVVPITGGDHTVKVMAREVGNGSFVTSRGVSIVFVPTGTGPLPWPFENPI